MANFTDPRVTEKRFLAIPPQQLTANGTVDGTITIDSTYCWKVGQIVTVISNIVPPRRLKIKAVISETELKVGDIGAPIYKFSDVSDLLVADTAMIELVDDSINSGSQASNRRQTIHLDEIRRAVYEEEPTIALRSHLVDWLGRSYSIDNPMPVALSSNINIGKVDADLTRLDNDPNPGDVHDSVRIGNQSVELDFTDDGGGVGRAKVLDEDANAKLEALTSALDFFGNQSVSMRTNQIEVPLDDVNWQNFVDIESNASGTFTQADGQITLETGTNADGRYAAISKDPVRYRPNSEIGWGWTWSFPVVSTAGVTLRIGATSDLTNWTDGVFLQHKDGQFSLVYNNDGVEILNVAPASWLDPCDGSSTSKYVDFSGTPVAIDITKDQLARVRAGLFGHAGFMVEILAPNQQWVTIYEYSPINSLQVSTFGQFDLYVGAEVKKESAGGNNYTLQSACWAGWTGVDSIRMNDPISDRTLTKITRSVIEGKSSAGGGTYVPVKVDPSGSLETVANQDTHDDLNANANIQVGDVDVSDSNPVPVKQIRSSLPNVVRVLVPNANTEVSYAFTANTKRFKFRVEKDDSKAQISYTAGQTNTNFWTVNRGSYYEERELDLSGGVTLYFELNKANQVVQILYWE